MLQCKFHDVNPVIPACENLKAIGRVQYELDDNLMPRLVDNGMI